MCLCFLSDKFLVLLYAIVTAGLIFVIRLDFFEVKREKKQHSKKVTAFSLRLYNFSVCIFCAIMLFREGNLSRSLTKHNT